MKSVEFSRKNKTAADSNVALDPPGLKAAVSVGSPAISPILIAQCARACREKIIVSDRYADVKMLTRMSLVLLLLGSILRSVSASRACGTLDLDSPVRCACLFTRACLFDRVCSALRFLYLGYHCGLTLLREGYAAMFPGGWHAPQCLLRRH